MNEATMSDDRGPACPSGWPIVDAVRRDDDPHQMDDCWHRGPYTVYTVRGTGIHVEQKPSDGIGDTFDRLMATVKAEGYVGHMWIIASDGYRSLQSNEMVIHA